MKTYKIAIDGPGGVGKSTLAKELAKELNCIYVDTGAMYRAVGLYCIENGIGADDKEAIANALDKINITIDYVGGVQHILLNNEDVENKIRSSEASYYASKVAVVKEVREKMVELQRKIAGDKNVLMDGRDIGTKVFPEADVKIFLMAADTERAKRRYNQMKEQGIEASYEEILKELRFRDRNDSTRRIDPLLPAEDAVMVDNTEYDFPQTFKEVYSIIKERLARKQI